MRFGTSVCLKNDPFIFKIGNSPPLFSGQFDTQKKTQTYSGTHAGTYHQQLQIIQKKVILFLSEEIMKKRNYESRKISTQKRRPLYFS